MNFEDHDFQRLYALLKAAAESGDGAAKSTALRSFAKQVQEVAAKLDPLNDRCPVCGTVDQGNNYMSTQHGIAIFRLCPICDTSWTSYIAKNE